MTMCKFSPVSCPNQCQTIIRKDLDKHLKRECMNREYECKHCGKKDTYANITQVHDETCEKKVLPCPNVRCTKIMKQANVESHLAHECDYTYISCKYKIIGCHKKLMRKLMRAHEQDHKFHFYHALKTMAQLKARNNLKRETSFICKLTEYEMKRSSGRFFYSQSFYTGSNGYCMCIQVHPNGYDAGKGSHVSVYIRFLKGMYDDELDWPFTGTVTCELLNQMADENHHSIKLVDPEDATKYSSNLQTGQSLGYNKFIAHSELLYDPVTNTQYLKDDTLNFRVSIDVSSQTDS